MFRHLLVPTDGSDLSDGTIRRAVSFASEAGARITFFHARESELQQPETSLYGEPVLIDPSVREQFDQARNTWVEELLASACTIAAAAGVPCDSDSSANPVIHEAIIEAAASHGCDLIFMASHGRRGLAGLLLGSETQRVLTHTSLPVLVDRKPDTAPA
ncbi:MAG: universal stress protein [Synechococcaceae cyanobacterium]|nr:universal stress protein [Synechococcaceae cyanobacterium]